MKKQNILKKWTLIVISSIMTIPGIFATTDAKNATNGKTDTELACPKLTTKDAGKNPKKKKSSGNGFVENAFATIGVLWAINKAHDLVGVLFGNPYFKLGMLTKLCDDCGNTWTVRGALLAPERALIHTLGPFQRIDQGSTSAAINMSTKPTTMESAEENKKATPGGSTSTNKTISVFKGIVSKMTDKEIEQLKAQGEAFSESNPQIAKLLLKRFDVLLIDASEYVASKIASLIYSNKP